MTTTQPANLLTDLACARDAIESMTMAIGRLSDDETIVSLAASIAALSGSTFAIASRALAQPTG